MIRKIIVSILSVALIFGSVRADDNTTYVQEIQHLLENYSEWWMFEEGAGYLYHWDLFFHNWDGYFENWDSYIDKIQDYNAKLSLIIAALGDTDSGIHGTLEQILENASEIYSDMYYLYDLRNSFQDYVLDSTDNFNDKMDQIKNLLESILHHEYCRCGSGDSGTEGEDGEETGSSSANLLPLITVIKTKVEDINTAILFWDHAIREPYSGNLYDFADGRFNDTPARSNIRMGGGNFFETVCDGLDKILHSGASSTILLSQMLESIKGDEHKSELDEIRNAMDDKSVSDIVSSFDKLPSFNSQTLDYLSVSEIHNALPNTYLPHSVVIFIPAWWNFNEQRIYIQTEQIIPFLDICRGCCCCFYWLVIATLAIFSFVVFAKFCNILFTLLGKVFQW